ncbi:MAG: tRNA glutamyl-Q(34) synthetase GluQRS, partial [Neisseriaceae bacterium]|nr:tRNA glutamyl-Q(34) synthetase GluQRS [Neisseriaceae bacterium]
MQYIGRFAPSPTGHLHIGSLLTAVASFIDAKAHNGAWLVRMEDLDKPREVAGAADDILRTLDTFSLHWDGEVVYQSQRHALYRAALDELKRQNAVYPCYCSRKTVQENGTNGIDGIVYN